jgi:glycosyltransferase involved in cell wall biosynthesis
VKLAYITNARIPSERANAMQTVHMCAAFATAGAQVTLYYPARRNLPQFENTDPWSYYGVPHNFELQPVPCVDWFHLTGGKSVLERFVFLWQTFTFATSLLSLLRRTHADLYYARDALVLATLAFGLPSSRPHMMFEMHSFPGSSWGQRLHRWLLTRIGKVVAITNGLRERLIKLGVSPGHILVAPDGVDLSRYPLTTRDAARAQLGITGSDTLSVYTGHLYAWKGAGVFAQAVAGVKGLRGLLVGGTKDNVAQMKRTVSENGWQNVDVVGYVAPALVPTYQAAADILVLPNSSSSEISRTYTSPLKLFEYMAANRPIVASDLPSLREVLNSDNALLVPPDDSNALAAALQQLQADVLLGQRLAQRARHDVEAYSWQDRAETILKAQ